MSFADNFQKAFGEARQRAMQQQQLQLRKKYYSDMSKVNQAQLSALANASQLKDIETQAQYPEDSASVGKSLLEQFNESSSETQEIDTQMPQPQGSGVVGTPGDFSDRSQSGLFGVARMAAGSQGQQRRHIDQEGRAGLGSLLASRETRDGTVAQEEERSPVDVASQLESRGVPTESLGGKNWVNIVKEAVISSGYDAGKTLKTPFGEVSSRSPLGMNLIMTDGLYKQLRQVVESGEGRTKVDWTYTDIKGEEHPRTGWRHEEASRIRDRIDALKKLRPSLSPHATISDVQKLTVELVVNAEQAVVDQDRADRRQLNLSQHNLEMKLIDNQATLRTENRTLVAAQAQVVSDSIWGLLDSGLGGPIARQWIQQQNRKDPSGLGHLTGGEVFTGDFSGEEMAAIGKVVRGLELDLKKEIHTGNITDPAEVLQLLNDGVEKKLPQLIKNSLEGLVVKTDETDKVDDPEGADKVTSLTDKVTDKVTGFLGGEKISVATRSRHEIGKEMNRAIEMIKNPDSQTGWTYEQKKGIQLGKRNNPKDYNKLVEGMKNLEKIEERSEKENWSEAETLAQMKADPLIWNFRQNYNELITKALGYWPGSLMRFVISGADSDLFNKYELEASGAAKRGLGRSPEMKRRYRPVGKDQEEPQVMFNRRKALYQQPRRQVGASDF